MSELLTADQQLTLYFIPVLILLWFTYRCRDEKEELILFLILISCTWIVAIPLILFILLAAGVFELLKKVFTCQLLNTDIFSKRL